MSKRGWRRERKEAEEGNTKLKEEVVGGWVDHGVRKGDGVGVEGGLTKLN